MEWNSSSNTLIRYKVVIFTSFLSFFIHYHHIVLRFISILKKVRAGSSSKSLTVNLILFAWYGEPVPYPKVFPVFFPADLRFFCVKFVGVPIVVQSHFQSKFNPNPIVFLILYSSNPLFSKGLVQLKFFFSWFPHAIESVSFLVFFSHVLNQMAPHHLLRIYSKRNEIFL